MTTYPLFSAASLTIAVFQTRKNAMAIRSEHRKTGVFTGDGKTTRYPFDFRIFKTEHIAVITDDAIGNEIILSEGRDYTAALETDGGHIDLVAPLDKGRRLVIVSNQPYLQQAVFTNHGGFYPANLNDALDKLVIQDQQIREQVGRALKASVISSVNLTLPAPSPGKGIGWNADGSGLENNNFHEQAAASAERAEAAAKQIENEVRKAASLLSGLKTIPTFASIDLMRQNTNSDSPAAIVSSYHEDKPGGGGIFIADARDKSSADNGGTVIVSADGTRWKRQIEGGRITLADFGILPDGTDVGAAINKAFEACAGLYLLVADVGTYLTSVELKAPTGLRFSGAGMYRTLIKAAPSLPLTANLLTNKSNNYETRTEYDHGIYISDITFDAEHHGRSSTDTTATQQACGVKFSAVRSSALINVRAINAPMNCFHICNDKYVNDGSIMGNTDNRSEHILLRGCVAENPYFMSGFSANGSRNITFDNCIALFETGAEPNILQQGFEAGEYASGIYFSNCTAKGYYCGYRSKGRGTTKPYGQTAFENCTAEKCIIGFEASDDSTLQNQRGDAPQNVRFLGCTAREPARNTQGIKPAALRIYGADSVYVESFHNCGTANIVIMQGAGYVSLNHILFTEKVGTEAAGCIEIHETAGRYSHTAIHGFKATVNQILPILVKNDAGAVLSVDNMTAYGLNGEAAVKLKRNPRDRISGLHITAYRASVFLIGDNIPLEGDCILDTYNKTYLFGNPNSNAKAPIGTIITTHQGTQYVQKSNNGLAPSWKQIIHAA